MRWVHSTSEIRCPFNDFSEIRSQFPIFADLRSRCAPRHFRVANTISCLPRNFCTYLDGDAHQQSAMATRVFGVGVDVAHVPRLARCAERFGARFLRRALHPSEIEEFHARCAADRPAFLASRWAAKEAVFKAFHGFRLQFPEVRVARSSTSTAAPPALPIEAPLRVLRLEFSGATAVRAKQLRLLVRRADSNCVGTRRRNVSICLWHRNRTYRCRTMEITLLRT